MDEFSKMVQADIRDLRQRVAAIEKALAENANMTVYCPACRYYGVPTVSAGDCAATIRCGRCGRVIEAEVGNR